MAYEFCTSGIRVSNSFHLIIFIIHLVDMHFIVIYYLSLKSFNFERNK